MKKMIFSVLSVALLSGSLSTPVLARDMQKFGYVNPERVYTETKQAQYIEHMLQKEFGEQQKQLQALEKQGLQLQQQLQSSKLSSKQRKQKEKQLLDLSRQYRMAAAKLGEEYNLRRNEEFAALQRNAQSIIEDIAKKDDYDLIIQEAVYVSRQYDITDRVIKALDKLK